jgi:uncharacterized delta-60 repeat protein
MLPFFFQTSTAFRLLSFSLAVLIINLCGWQSARAKVQLDNTFVPILGARNAAGPNSALVLPDGKLVVIRLSSQILPSTEEYKVTRLNADGSVDRIFDSVVLNRGDGKLVLQPDGKILVLSVSIFAGGVNRGGLVRLNADGTLDTSFNPVGIIYAGAAVIQPDGRIIVGALIYDTSQGTNRGATFRLNTDGSLDQSFTRFVNTFSYDAPETLALQADGKILIGYGRSSVARIQRINSDGTLDTVFSNNLPSSSGSGSLYQTTSILIQSDGRIIIGGSGVLRLNSDGTPDFAYPAYSAYGGYIVFRMIRQPDDKIIIGGNGWYGNPLPSPMKKLLTRINPDGTQDATFNAMTNEDFGFGTIIPLALRPNGTILVNGVLTQGNVHREGLFSLNPNGTIDQTFTPDGTFVDGVVSTLKAQPDGKILVAGYFALVNNFPANGLARLNPDGSADTGFSFPAEITIFSQNFILPIAIAFQADGKILVGGNFRYNAQNNYGVFRLNQNGSLDSSFTPSVFTPTPNYPLPGVTGIAVQADGKILVGGVFQNYANSGRNNLVRLNPDGSVDASYPITSGGIYKMLIQPGGKIVISGSVTENGNTRTNPRLNTDGTIDPTFNMPTDVGGLYAVAPDGKLATSGLFPHGKDQARFVFRLNADGSRDTSFAATIFFSSFNDLIFQPDDRIIALGPSTLYRFDGLGRYFPIFRHLGADLRVGLVTQGKHLIVGGQFSNLAGARRTGIARFFLSSSDFDFDGDGKADISLFRPSVGDWYILRSSDGESFGTNFGLAGDLIAPADFDGDGKTDISVFRPGDGGWYRLNSLDNTFTSLQFGANGDLPVPGDFDGDGRADVAVYRPSAGSWYRVNSSNQQFVGAQFGVAEDKPIVGDFDGDGKSDLTVYRPSTGNWYRINSFDNQFVGAQFGTAGDKPVAADYDGDGKSDLAVYRPSNGYWYHVNSGNAYTFIATQFGIAEDKPAPADFDGDGKADFAVFRPSNGTWYLLRSTAGFTGVQYGANGDLPAPNAFVR